MRAGKGISEFWLQLGIIVLGALLFIPFTGQVHLFDWDEINFAESAREMLVTGNFIEVQIDYQTFWEKPPLFIWMQALSMAIFGVGEFAARFPNAICGMCTLLVLYRIGKQVHNREGGLIWVAVYMASFFPFFYFKSGIIDPWFNLFILLGLYYLFRYFCKADLKFAVAAGVFTGLAVLTKGPVGALIVILSAFIFIIIKRFKVKIAWGHVFFFFLVLVLTGGFWCILMLFRGQEGMILDFIQYQVRLFRTEDAGHSGFFLYHFIVIFIGVFPASVLALSGFNRKKATGLKTDFHRMMLILFWTVMVLFTIVETKIVHYSSMAWFPVTFLASRVIARIRRGEMAFPAWMRVLLLVMGVIYALLVASVPLMDRCIDRIISKGWINDPFAVANLQADAGWQGFEAFLGIFLPAGIVLMLILYHKKKLKPLFYPLLIGAVLFIYSTMACITPRIERYTQHAAIEFYKNFQGSDKPVYPLGFKSYAHLFYTRKMPVPEAERQNKNHYLNGDIEKTAYFVTKVHRLDKELEKHPDLKVMYKKNGFVFCRRDASPPKE